MRHAITGDRRDICTCACRITVPGPHGPRDSPPPCSSSPSPPRHNGALVHGRLTAFLRRPHQGRRLSVRRPRPSVAKFRPNLVVSYQELMYHRAMRRRHWRSLLLAPRLFRHVTWLPVRRALIFILHPAPSQCSRRRPTYRLSTATVPGTCSAAYHLPPWSPPPRWYEPAASCRIS